MKLYDAAKATIEFHDGSVYPLKSVSFEFHKPKPRSTIQPLRLPLLVVTIIPEPRWKRLRRQRRARSRARRDVLRSIRAQRKT